MTTRVAIVTSLLLSCAIAQQPPVAAPQRRTITPDVAGKQLCGSSDAVSASASKTIAPKANTLCGPVPRPLYPAEAKEKGIEGAVLLKALIGTEGTVQELQVIDGHPLLAPAAIEAVKRWKYKPFFVADKPTEVETIITVNFTLQKRQRQ